MDRRRLRSSHDVEGNNGLVRVAAKAFHLEKAELGVKRAQRGAGAAPDPESRASACSTPRRPNGRLPCVLPSPALPPPALMPAALRLKPLEFRAWLRRRLKSPPLAAPIDLARFRISDGDTALLMRAAREPPGEAAAGPDRNDGG